MIYDVTIFLDVKAYKSLFKTTNGKICKCMERVGGLTAISLMRPSSWPAGGVTGWLTGLRVLPGLT